MANRKLVRHPTARSAGHRGRSAMPRSATAERNTSGVAVKLAASIYTAAKESADRNHRSVPKQLEFWADMGRVLDEAGVSKVELMEATQALRLRSRNMPTRAQSLVQELVGFFAEPSTRIRADFASMIGADQGPIYGTDPGHPGKFVEKRPDGSEVIGTFRDGNFVADEVAVQRRQYGAQAGG